MRLRALLLGLACLPALAAQPPLPVDGPGQFLGVETCGSSQCHGSPEPWRNATVLMSERRIWAEQDPHARATESLRTPAAQKIADALRLGPAEAAESCRSCHATQVPKAQQGPRYHENVGITCESCHGAGGNFLTTHVQNTSTHAGNIAAGLYPTTDARARATLCASCHVGDARRSLPHAAFAAGHPRLRFELDTYSGLLPAHARIDADYRRRKPVPSSVRLWAAGQLAAARNLVERHARAHGTGLFPDFAQYDCHACHHRLDAHSTRRPALGLPPGAPPLQDAPLLLLPALAQLVAPELQAQTAALPRRLQQAAAAARPGTPALAPVLASLDALSRRLATHVDRPEDGQCLTAALLALPQAAAPLPQAAAEALAMSVASLLLGEREAGRLSEAAYRALTAEVDALYAALRLAANEQPAAVATAAAGLRQQLMTAGDPCR